MVEAGIEGKEGFRLRSLIPRFFKASLKTLIAYVIFAVILSSITIPFEGIYGYQELFTVFFAFYIFFIFIIEFTKGTVFQHVFSIANSLMVVLYFSYIMNTGVINYAIEQIVLMVDLRFFLSIFVLGGMLGLAKNMLQFVNWMNDREERWLQLQIKSL